jgi:SAM-dependent methyltransferase
MMSPAQSGLKSRLKHLAMRAIRPGVAPLAERIEAMGRELVGVQERVRAMQGNLDALEADRHKYDSELEYWRWLVKKGGSEKGFGAPFAQVFARWTRDRMVKMGEFLGLPAVGQAGDIDDWARERSVIEIGAGPFPLIASAHKGWRRCVAVDPIARGYVEEDLVPPAAAHIVYVAARGESIPLPSASADLVVIENCLDHVRSPAEVLQEINRLLAPGGLLWIFVDLSNHVDHMHPHAMNEQKVRTLLGEGGFDVVRDEVTSHKAHPEAYGSYCGLLRKVVTARARVGEENGTGRSVEGKSENHAGQSNGVRVVVEPRTELSLNGSAAGRPRN